MESYFKESEEEFIKYIKKYPFCTVQQWDYYAEANRLYSANTLRAHIITEETADLIKKLNADTFIYMKEIYIILPSIPIRLLKRIRYYYKKAQQHERN